MLTLTTVLVLLERGADMHAAPLDLSAVVTPRANRSSGTVSSGTPFLKRLLPSEIQLQADTPESPCTAMVDPGQLNNALLNLVLNSSHALGGSGHIRLSVARVDSEHLQLTVDDDGPGMTEEVRKRAVDPFFTTKGPDIGTGLGLPAAQELLSRHGGLIEFESRPGRTVFFVRIPLQQKDPAA